MSKWVKIDREIIRVVNIGAGCKSALYILQTITAFRGDKIGYAVAMVIKHIGSKKGEIKLPIAFIRRWV